MQSANLKQIRIHDFRHSCASLLINNGANITVVAQYLGHSDIEMTLKAYTHLIQKNNDEIIKVLDCSNKNFFK